MTADDVIKSVACAVLALLSGAVTWVVTKVIGNRESVIKLEGRVSFLERQQVTKEDVREVVEEIFAKGEVNTELKIRQAVQEEVTKAFSNRDRGIVP